jgi:hypothetical protein
MSLETTRLLKVIESLHDALLEIQIGGDASKVCDQVAADFSNPSFQRGYLMGLGRILKCDGTPAFLSGDETRIITSHIKRIGVTFGISGKEAA